MSSSGRSAEIWEMTVDGRYWPVSDPRSWPIHARSLPDPLCPVTNGTFFNALIIESPVAADADQTLPFVRLGHRLDLGKTLENPRSQARYAAATRSKVRQNIGHHEGTPGSSIKRA